MPFPRNSSAASHSAASAANANAPPTDIRATPSAASSATAGAPRTASTFTGRSTDSTTRRMSSELFRPGREQHVGARLLVGLQPRDRVGQIVTPADVVLRASGEHQPDRPRVCDLDGGRDPLAGEVEVVDPIIIAARVVLHRAPSQARLHREPDRLRHAGGVVGERVLEIGRHRQVGAPGERGGMRQGLVPGYGSVEPTRAWPRARCSWWRAPRTRATRAPRPSRDPTRWASAADRLGRWSSRNLFALSV